MQSDWISTFSNSKYKFPEKLFPRFILLGFFEVKLRIFCKNKKVHVFVFFYKHLIKAYIFMTDFRWRHDCTSLDVFLFRRYLNLISKNISCSVPSSTKGRIKVNFYSKVCLIFIIITLIKCFLFMNYFICNYRMIIEKTFEK